MSLKEQVPNVYHVGTRNVGSYRVPGIPHITTATILNGGEANISFQSVTKDIKITKNTLGGALRVHFASKGAGHTPKALGTRDADSDGAPDEICRIPVNMTPPYTFSLWFRIPYNLPAAAGPSPWRIIGGHFMKIRYRTHHSPPNYTFSTIVRSTGGDNFHDVPSPATYYDPVEWHNYVLSVGLTEFSTYVDGSDYGVGPTPINGTPTNLGTIDFPREWSPLMETTHTTFWNKNLNSSEVSELYNSGNFFDPTTHSAANDLSGWLRFDDTLTPPDTTSQIFDRVGNLTGSILLNNVTPWLPTQTQTSAQFVSAPNGWFSGSANAPNTITGGHYVTLTDSSPSITLRCSCKEIYLSAAGGNQTASVMANLTNISSAGIPDLTGVGIDE